MSCLYLLAYSKIDTLSPFIWSFSFQQLLIMLNEDYCISFPLSPLEAEKNDGGETRAYVYEI